MILLCVLYVVWRYGESIRVLESALFVARSVRLRPTVTRITTVGVLKSTNHKFNQPDWKGTLSKPRYEHIVGSRLDGTVEGWTAIWRHPDVGVDEIVRRVTSMGLCSFTSHADWHRSDNVKRQYISSIESSWSLMYQHRRDRNDKLELAWQHHGVSITSICSLTLSYPMNLLYVHLVSVISS